MGQVLPGATGRDHKRPLSMREAGKAWEIRASQYLSQRGLKLLESNVHCRLGELDLVMQDGDTTVFVEVRYRADDVRGSGADTITPVKINRICRAAGLFLARNPDLAERPCRFDVISISGAGNDEDLQWIPNAFESTI